MPGLPPPITSRTNARVKALRQALSGEARKPGDLLGLEGPNLIQDAHMRGLKFETVYVREGSERVLERPARWGETLRTRNWVVLSPEVFDSAVTTSAPQGVAATWIIEDPPPREGRRCAGLVLENIQDPGNLGTLIRSAAAFGLGDVMVTPDCANHWNPKVVRAAAGASFVTRVQRTPLAEIGAQLRSEGVRIFAAVSGFLSGPEFGFPVMAGRHGVLTGRIDNVRASEEFRYREHPLDGDGPEGERYAASLSYDTDFVEPCAILIGNEGAGLSQEARRLADEQVLIPCSVESLNAAVAGSVLMYEVMRQRTLRAWARTQGLRP